MVVKIGLCNGSRGVVVVMVLIMVVMAGICNDSRGVVVVMMFDNGGDGRTLQWKPWSGSTVYQDPWLPGS